MATMSERALRISEKQFMAQVIELARLCKWMAFHPFDSRRSTPGWPDIVFVRPPSVIFAELKTATGRLTPAQQTWLEALGRCPGVEAYVWRPADWEAIVSRLQKRDFVGTNDTELLIL
jgi:hypothetical protein